MPNAEYIIENQISEPKSSLGVFELPCGLMLGDGTLAKSVTIREITGAEEDMLASKKVHMTKKMSELLANCCQSIGDISVKEAIREATPKLLIGDRVFLLLAIRRVSLGDVYPFTVACPSCELPNLYDVDLSTFDVKLMPDPLKRVYELVTPRGVKVRWHPMDGRGEESLAKLQSESDKITLALLVRLDMVNDMPPTLETIKAMGISERNYIRDAFQEVEGGVDTNMDMECPKCGHEFSIDIDIGQQGFFFPSAMKRASK